MKMQKRGVYTKNDNRIQDGKHIRKVPFVSLTRINVGNKRIETGTTKASSFNSEKKMVSKCLLPVVRLERCNFSNYMSVGQKKRIHQNENQSIKDVSVSKIIPGSTYLENHKMKNVHCNKQNAINQNTLVDYVKDKQINFLDHGLKKNELHEADEVTLKKVLRERKRVNYEEKKSIGTPEVNYLDKSNIKIPIYKKQLETSFTPKASKRDHYAFIPESDEDSDVSYQIKTPAKKRKIVHQKNNKTVIKSILRNGGEKQVQKYEDKVSKIMKNLRCKINKEGNKTTEDSQHNRILTLGKENGQKMNKIFNSTQISNSFSLQFPNESLVCANERTLSEQEISIPCVQDQIVPSSCIIHLNESNSKSNHCPKKFSGSAIDNNSEGIDSDQYSTPTPENTVFVHNKSDPIEQMFGFEMDVGENIQNRNDNRVNIVQNVILKTPHMTNSEIMQPWRFDLDYVSRNPHFIDIKKNALPSLNQELILDHTFDDYIQKVNKTVVIPENRTSPKQQSILNFVQTDKDHFEKVTQRQSLFDIEDLSPIKKKDKENEFKNQILTRKKRAVARRILGELSENTLTKDTSTPVKTGNVPVCSDLSFIEKNMNEDSFEEKKRTQNSYDKESNFGFDDSSFDMENKNEKKENESEPYRLDLISCRKYTSKKLPEKFMQPVRDSEIRRLVEDDPGFDRLVENDKLDCGNVKLFEDMEVSENITNACKARTRKKILDGLERPKKNVEVKLSKEAKNWIKEFNHMCEEVDQVQLEIE